MPGRWVIWASARRRLRAENSSPGLPAAGSISTLAAISGTLAAGDPPSDPKIGEPDDDDHQKQQPRHGRRAAEVQLSPTQLVEVDGHRHPLLICSAKADLVVQPRFIEDLE